MSSSTPEEAAAARAVRQRVDALAERQPAVADWPARVHQRVARRKAQRTSAAAVAVVVTVCALAVGAATGVSDPPDELFAGPAPVVTTSADEPSASPDQDRSAPPSIPSRSAAPSQKSDPTPAPTAANPTPEPQAEASWPPFGTQQIRIDAHPSDPNPAVGEELVVEVTVTGKADREPFLQGPRIDDSGPGWIVSACPPPPEGSPPPAQPQTVRKTFRHTFTTAGRHELAFRADSSCSYYRGEAEHVLIVDVQPAS